VLPRRFQLVERGAVYLTAEALQMRFDRVESRGELVVGLA